MSHRRCAQTIILDTATEDGSLGSLAVWLIGSVTGIGFGLLSTAVGHASLESLAILALGSVVGWFTDSWVKKRTLGESDMEPTEAAWCRRRRKEFERSL